MSTTRMDERKNLILIIAVSVLIHIGFAGSRVSMSLCALHLGASQFTIGALIALYALCPMLLSIVIGRFADRVPKRVPMIVGAAGLFVALLLPPLVPGVPTLYISAFVLGLCNQMFHIPMEALIGGIGGSAKRARNFSAVTMGFSVAAFTGPLVAGFAIDTIGHLRVFLVLATFIVPPLAIMLMTPAMFPRIAAEAGRHARGSVFDLLRMANLRSILIAGSIAFSAWDLFQFYLPIYGYGVGLSASTIGTILAIFSVASFLIRGAVPFLAKRVSEVHLLTSSVFIAALASALLPFFVSAYALAAISFLLGVAVGCTTPVEMSLIYVLTPRDRMAEAMGLRKTVNHGMHFFVPLVFGTLGGTFGATSVFVSNAVLLAMGGFLMRNTRVPGDGHRMTTTIVTPAAPEPRTMPPQ